MRLLTIAAALASSTLLLGTTAADAQSTSYYSAVPVAKPGKTSFIARDTVWTWRDSGFTARRGDDRDSVQCELVARQAGKLVSFTVGGTAFAPEALEKCNTKAK